ncbi:MAG: aspartyl/asparaginyl beta-hydroxylase domain-containing protein [Synechococcales cyanobacterium K44_A2020_017]|nr:aspartyl/asparaginyl beta-hydroxylase domain-containing protein [Synechococcales cyanobacterium K32_A2020_035]MBF2095686.1 aspartyl/asparaginyl beta-hydroxylase domain-containing protein [Synechococcales cyanobacterium K44_A2020_017]
MAKHFPKILGWTENFAASIGGELGRVTVVRLAPYGRVYRHIDHGDYYRVRDRYHLVLKSEAGSVLGAGNEWVRMQEGELWWFNNKAPHEAYNESSDWRVHLIFDVLRGDRSFA